MPKFIITERIPATLVWRYEVEADNEEDALDQVIDNNVEATEYTTEEDMFEDPTYDITEEGAE